MQLPLQIAVRNTTLDGATERQVRRLAAKLDTFYDRIMGCRVMVEVPQRHRIGRPIAYRVRIDLTLPGRGDLVVRRREAPDLLTAIQDAFDVAGRRLQDVARRQQGAVKRHEAAPRGVVRRLLPYDGYGFLETADGREVYFHRNAVLHGGFDRLKVGDEVRFVEEGGAEGPQASTVAPAGAGA